MREHQDGRCIIFRGWMSLALALGCCWLQVTPAQAQDQTPETESQVEFFQPALGTSPKPGVTRVMITGKAPAGTQALVSGNEVVYFTSNNVLNKLSLKQALISKRRVTVDDKGLFEFILDLPNEKVQVTLKFKTPQNAIETYQLNLQVTPQAVQVQDQADLKPSPLYTKRFGAWFGTGFNFLSYKQASGDIGSDLEFQTFKGPSLFALGWWNVNENLDANASAKVSPGEVRASDAIQIAAGNYNWLIFALEGTYFPKMWHNTLFSEYPTRWGVRFGIQHHIVPFISRTGASTTEAEIVTNSLSMFTIGIQSTTRISDRWSFEWIMRYQSPLATGSTFDIRPDFAFDGSLGVVYSWRGPWRIGGYWYGQWHDYSFTHQDRYLVNTNATETRITGRQSLFFSNAELRLGYEFN